MLKANVEEFFNGLRQTFISKPPNSRIHGPTLVRTFYSNFCKQLPSELTSFIENYLLFGNLKKTKTYINSDEGKKALKKYLKKLHINTCDLCGNRIYSKQLYKVDSHRFCSTICSAKSPLTKMRKEESYLKTLGVTNPWKLESVRQKALTAAKSPESLRKRKDTRERHKQENPDYVNNYIEKSKSTCLVRYGETNYSKTKDAKLKQKKYYQENFGVDCNFQTKQFKKKSKKTCLEKYGSSRYSNSTEGRDAMSNFWKNNPEFKKQVRKKAAVTMIDRYGASFSSHVPEILDKIQESRFSRKTFKIQGVTFKGLLGYEPFALRYLVEDKNVPVNHIQTGLRCIGNFAYYYDNKKHLYYPDFFVEDKIGTYIEVKSLYTYQNDINRVYLKLNSIVKAGYKAMLLIFDSKGNLIHKELFRP